MPTFPNATYIFAGDEWEFWWSEHEADTAANACIGDSVQPVVEAGQVQLVDSHYMFSKYVRFEPFFRPYARSCLYAADHPGR